MENNNNLKDILGGSRSVLNVDTQKELIDHTIQVSTRNALKVFFIIFPTVILSVCLLLYVIFKFVGILK